MKKILVLVMLCISMNVFSQNIPNASFENWVNNGPFLTPEAWAGNGALIQSGFSHSGDFSIQLSVDTLTNMQTSTLDTIAPNAYTGAQTMGPPQPGASVGGYAFTASPDSLIGWVKYTSIEGDGFRIIVELSRWDTVSASRSIIATAFYSDFVTIDDFTRFAIPLEYSSSETPDTAFIQIESANMQSKHIGTTLWVDDLDFTFGNTAVNNIEMSKLVNVFPNPAHDILTVETNTLTNGDIISVYNIQGQLLLQQSILQSKMEINISMLSKGIYILKIQNEEVNIAKRFIKE